MNEFIVVLLLAAVIIAIFWLVGYLRNGIHRPKNGDICLRCELGYYEVPLAETQLKCTACDYVPDQR